MKFANKKCCKTCKKVVQTTRIADYEKMRVTRANYAVRENKRP